MGALRGDVHPAVKRLIHEVFLGIEGVKEGHVLIDLAFSVDLPVFSPPVVRTRNLIYFSMNDLISRHMGEKPAGKSKLVIVHTLPFLFLPSGVLPGKLNEGEWKLIGFLRVEKVGACIPPKGFFGLLK